MLIYRITFREYEDCIKNTVINDNGCGLKLAQDYYRQEGYLMVMTNNLPEYLKSIMMYGKGPNKIELIGEGFVIEYDKDNERKV